MKHLSQKPLKSQTVQKLLNQKKFSKLKIKLNQLYPVDVARIFENLKPESSLILLRLLSKDQAAAVFSHLKKDSRVDLASLINPLQLSELVNNLDFDDKIDFLEEMPANFVKKLIAHASEKERQLINQFLRYPENSAGSLMTIEYIDLKKTMTVTQALQIIRTFGPKVNNFDIFYVLNSTRQLEGTITLKDLVLAAENEKVGSLMNREIILAHTKDDQEELANLFKKYDLSTIPVVDSEQRLIGITTIDDIIDVIEEENTEDMEKMAAMSPSDEAYLDTPILTLARKRIVWLLVLMISATFTGAIISHYESLLSAAVILTAFIPMLMDSGGNAGSQSSTLIIRGMALNEINLHDWAKVLWKELRVSLLVGLALALVNFARMWLMNSADLAVTITVSITLLLTVVAAKLVGGLLPLAAKALKLDPAIMAGPLITTIVDAFSLVIYFAIAGFLIL